MKKFGLLKNNVIESVFITDRPASDFPDIQALLVELPDTVDCNWTFDGSTYSPPAQTQAANLARLVQAGMLTQGQMNAILGAS